jgi:hypothetical protein
MNQPRNRNNSNKIQKKGEGQKKTKRKHKKLLEIERIRLHTPNKLNNPRYNIRAPLIQEIAEN